MKRILTTIILALLILISLVYLLFNNNNLHDEISGLNNTFEVNSSQSDSNQNDHMHYEISGLNNTFEVNSYQSDSNQNDQSEIFGFDNSINFNNFNLSSIKLDSYVYNAFHFEDEFIYVASTKNSFYKINLKTKEIVWKNLDNKNTYHNYARRFCSSEWVTNYGPDSERLEIAGITSPLSADNNNIYAAGSVQDQDRDREVYVWGINKSSGNNVSGWPVKLKDNDKTNSNNDLLVLGRLNIINDILIVPVTSSPCEGGGSEQYPHMSFLYLIDIHNPSNQEIVDLTPTTEGGGVWGRSTLPVVNNDSLFFGTGNCNDRTRKVLPNLNKVLPNLNKFKVPPEKIAGVGGDNICNALVKMNIKGVKEKSFDYEFESIFLPDDFLRMDRRDLDYATGSPVFINDKKNKIKYIAYVAKNQVLNIFSESEDKENFRGNKIKRYKSLLEKNISMSVFGGITPFIKGNEIFFAISGDMTDRAAGQRGIKIYKLYFKNKLEPKLKEVAYYPIPWVKVPTPVILNIKNNEYLFAIGLSTVNNTRHLPMGEDDFHRKSYSPKICSIELNNFHNFSCSDSINHQLVKGYQKFNGIFEYKNHLITGGESVQLFNYVTD